MLRLMATVVSLVAALIGPLSAGAQEATPAGTTGSFTILAPGRPAYGKGVGEWAAEWWAWSERSEATDCAPSDDGRVWFLTPVPTDAADLTGLRLTCRLPSGAPVFFAVLVNAGVDTAACEGGNEAFLQGVGGLGAVEVEIDGEVVPDLGRFRVEPSPLPEPIPYPAPAASPEATPASVLLTTACGYAFVLDPLPAGEHLLRTRVEANGEIVVDILGEITVEAAD